MSVTWFNGEIVSGMIALDPADRGLSLGDGVFETIAVRKSRAIWLDEHLERMNHAANELEIAFDEASLRAAVYAVLAQSRSEVEVLRLTLTRGPVTPRALTGHGEHPNLIVTLNSFTATHYPETIALATSSIRRNEHAPSSRLKTLSYIDSIAAAREVTARADDALMLNTKGNIASTTIGNLFVLRGDELLTPALDQGILAGITRAKILAHAKAFGLNGSETILTLNDFKTAEAVFRCNSLRLVTKVSKLDGNELGQRSIEFIRDFVVSLQEN